MCNFWQASCFKSITHVFMVGFPENFAQLGTSLRITVTNAFKKEIEVLVASSHWQDSSYYVAPGTSLTVNLDSEFMVTGSTQTTQGVEITTSGAAKVYAEEVPLISPMEGTLVIPKRLLGRCYIVVTGTPTEGATHSEVLIVGVIDNTFVTVIIKSTTPVVYNGVNYFDGDVVDMFLDKFDTAQIQSEMSDLTGTYIEASQPVSVISANQAIVIDGQDGFMLEQMLPIEVWHTHYVTVPPIGSFYSCRMVAASPDTLVWYRCDVTSWQSISLRHLGSDVTLEFGDVVCEVIATQPIMLTMIIHSGSYDPSMVALQPIKDIQSYLIFHVSDLLDHAQLILVTLEEDLNSILIDGQPASNRRFSSVNTDVVSVVEYVVSGVHTIITSGQSLRISGYVFGRFNNKTVAYSIVLGRNGVLSVAVVEVTVKTYRNDHNYYQDGNGFLFNSNPRICCNPTEKYPRCVTRCPVEIIFCLTRRHYGQQCASQKLTTSKIVPTGQTTTFGDHVGNLTNPFQIKIPTWSVIYCGECSSGRSCERQFTPSSHQVCLPGGQGTVACQKGYTYSDSSRTCTNINECLTLRACQNGARCEDTVGGYSCVCGGAWTGQNCTEFIDQCLSAPCKNGATCFTQQGTYSCACANGWTGSHCENDIDECLSLPCENNGTCINDRNGYTCNCTDGWTGTTCSKDENECLSTPCQHNGLCINTQGDYLCNCTSGWSGLICDRDVDECQTVQCLNGATCVNTHGGYFCNCTTGWSGASCDQDIDECQTVPCQNGATCVNTPGGYICSCTIGWKGNNCKQDINECNSVPCRNNATCINNDGWFSCNCTDNWQGTTCGSDVDECQQNPCLHDGHCININGGFICNCTDNWQGTTCGSDVDECKQNPCHHDGQCININGGYFCNCTDNWEGFRCADDVNECQDNNPCFNDGRCINTEGGYHCNCSERFFGIDCSTDINECLNSPCGQNGNCTNTVGGFVCECDAGWKGLRCDADINECLNSPCGQNGNCTNTEGGFVCECGEGWTGVRCDADINECLNSPCGQNGNCKNTVGGFICECNGGWTGLRCDADINECLISPCGQNGNCTNTVGGFVCECGEGWTGRRCDADINECLNSPCGQNGNCTNTVGGFVCECGEGWTGLRCDADINECLNSPCGQNGNCTNIVGGFVCECDEGWSGRICEEDIDDCTSNPCKNDGTCSDKVNGFVCTCVTGYTGTGCDEAIDDCKDNPCQNGGICHDMLAGYRCDCPSNYKGISCETIIVTSASTSIQTLSSASHITTEKPHMPSIDYRKTSLGHLETSTPLNQGIDVVNTSPSPFVVSTSSATTKTQRLTSVTSHKTTTKSVIGSSSEQVDQSQGWLSDNKYIVIAGASGLVALISLTALIAVCRRKKRNYGRRQTSVDSQRSLKFENHLYGTHSEAFA
ncbi:neurogenic locus notch homolog protein 2-like [Argopecten irradians]|uniref:neurogenic locus notch homolog protein 2-like n=1 Tax=Argopecten irradians TaxID=31199 RepID=UPI00371D033D